MDSKFNREKDNLKSLSGEPFMPMEPQPTRATGGSPSSGPRAHPQRAPCCEWSLLAGFCRPLPSPKAQTCRAVRGGSKGRTGCGRVQEGRNFLAGRAPLPLDFHINGHNSHNSPAASHSRAAGRRVL